MLCYGTKLRWHSTVITLDMSILCSSSVYGTFLHQNIRISQCWTIDGKGGFQVSSGKDGRLIIHHAGSKDGFDIFGDNGNLVYRLWQLKSHCLNELTINVFGDYVNLVYNLWQLTSVYFKWFNNYCFWWLWPFGLQFVTTQIILFKWFNNYCVWWFMAIWSSACDNSNQCLNDLTIIVFGDTDYGNLVYSLWQLKSVFKWFNN